MASTLPRRARYYIWASVLPALIVLAATVVVDHHSSVALPWLVYPFFLAVGWVSEEYRLLTRHGASHTQTAVVHLPLILLLTPLEATALAAASVICSQLRRRRSLTRMAYNTVVRVVSVGIPSLGLALWYRSDARFRGHNTFLDARLLQGLVQGRNPSTLVQLPTWSFLLFSVELVLACGAVALLYFALDSILISTIVAVQTATSPFSSWQANIRATILPELTKSVLGIISACIAAVNPFLVVFVALPIVVTHFTSQAILRLEHETIDAVTALADAIDYRDPYTAQHSVRVADISRRLAQRLGLSREQIDEITLAARVHDLGKIGIPNDILLKNGKLTAEEMAVMQTHPRIGAEVLQKYRNFQRALPIVLHHHERYDGKGYPDGLCSHDIPLGAQIVAHADAFDAMISDRPYRKGLRPDMALQRVSEATGTQFDPVVAGVFVAMIREDLAAAGQLLPDTGGSLAEPAPVPRAAGEDKVRYLYKK